MPAAVIGPIIAAGIAGGATIYAANKSSGANTQAAQTEATANTQAAQLQTQAANQAAADQLQAAEDALAFTKQVYATKQQQLSPYIGVGQGALAKLANGLGVTPVAQPSVAALLNPSALAATTPPTGPNSWRAPAGTPPSSTPTPGGTPAPVTAATVNPASTQNLSQSSVGAAQVGDQRIINGQLARWDGQGWTAVS